MRDNASFELRAEQRVNQGLLGQWYAACKTVQVKPGKPHPIRVLGRNLVLWRNENGALQCVEDYCPHRGAQLSRGEVHEGFVTCRYHGIMIDGTGKVVRVPAMPDCALEGRRPLSSYSVTEAMDAVFVYIPSKAQPDAPSLTLPAEFTSPDWTGFLCVSPWACNYRYALDNLADPMHGTYLHANSFTLAYGAKQDLMKVDDTNDGFIIARTGQIGENFDWTEMITETPALYCRLDIPYPAKGGPGGPFRIIGFTTPVDEDNCLVFFWRLRKVSGTAREAWRFLYRAFLDGRHWHVLEQDREMLVNMPTDARKREMLYQHDIGVTRLRRILLSKAKAQIADEDAALTQASA